MYRRYTNRNEAGLPRSGKLHSRIRDAVILLLAAAVVVLCVLGIPAMQARRDQRVQMIQRIQAECDEALRQTSSLSRSAGADSTAILARIRSSVYAIRTTNSLCSSFGYGWLVEDTTLQSIQESVDRYLSYLTTGMDTGEYQTGLQNALANLQGVLAALE